MAIVQAVENGKLVDTSASASSVSLTQERSSNTLGQQDFLELLVAEMQYQDPLEPQSNTEFIAQLATFTQVQDIEEMQGIVQNMQGNSLIGKYVILKVTSAATGDTNYVSGVVDYVTYEDGKTYLSVNDGLYSIDDLETVTTSDYMELVTLVNQLEDMIAELPAAEDISLTNEDAVKNAWALYTSMTAEQQKYLSYDDAKKLTDALTRLNILKGNISGT